MKLPDEMLMSADQTSNEEAWFITDFPEVLDLATLNGLVCVGGQFQFRSPVGIAEMYWLNADSIERKHNESWDAYVVRANSEVKTGFERIIRDTDFDLEARGWHHIQTALTNGTITDPKKYLVFVAYFSERPPLANELYQ